MRMTTKAAAVTLGLVSAIACQVSINEAKNPDPNAPTTATATADAADAADAAPAPVDTSPGIRVPRSLPKGAPADAGAPAVAPVDAGQG